MQDTGQGVGVKTRNEGENRLLLNLLVDLGEDPVKTLAGVP